MALSPSIPTSFVPKQPVTTGNRKYSGGNNLLLIIAAVIFACALLASGGVFLYDQYLTSVEHSKAAELLREQQHASQDTVDQFLRLSNRLVAAKSILSQHIVLSQLYTLIGNITVRSVHFDSLNVTVAADRSAQIAMVGQAKDFNSLAAESSVFASQKYIKSAIFSGIGVNKDSSVSFTLNAIIDPSLILESAAPTSTPSTSAGAGITATTSPASAFLSTPLATSTSAAPAVPAAKSTSVSASSSAASASASSTKP